MRVPRTTIRTARNILSVVLCLTSVRLDAGDVASPVVLLWFVHEAESSAAWSQPSLDLNALAPLLRARGVALHVLHWSGSDAELRRAHAQFAQRHPEAGGHFALASNRLGSARIAELAARSRARGLLLMDAEPVSARETANPRDTRLPLLQVFSGCCIDANEILRTGPAFAQWLNARYPSAREEAELLYGDPTDPQVRVRALRDAQFIDGAWARARDNATNWLAVVESPVDALQRQVLLATFADYLAAFVHRGDPNVAGRPQWPAYDDGARRFLLLGATVRTARDPLIDAVDLRDTPESRAQNRR